MPRTEALLNNGQFLTGGKVGEICKLSDTFFFVLSIFSKSEHKSKKHIKNK